MKTAIGVFVVAAVSAIGDYVWYEFGVQHRVLVGVLHGAVLLTAVGGAVGATSGRLAAGLPLGAVAGVGGALVYYALTPVVGGGSMLLAWTAVWMFLATLDGRLLRNPVHSWTEIGARGAVAAVLSGVTFYLVLSRLWGAPPAEGRNYLMQFLAWAVAWGPGLVALTSWSQRPKA